MSEKKKVCMFVYNNFTHDARVEKEATTLVKNGYDVRVIAVLDKSTESFEVKDGIRVTRINRNPVHYKILKFIKALAFLPKRLLKSTTSNDSSTRELQNIKTNAQKIPSRKENTILYKYLCKFLLIFHRPLCFLDYYYRAYLVVRNEPADIYHAHDLNTLPIAWYLCNKLGGKLIYDSHELYTETSTLSNKEKFLSKAIEMRLISKCDNVITVCDSIADELVQRYSIKTPTVLMNCPIITKGINNTNLIREKTGIPNEEPVVLYQGGFSVNRGLGNLILAMHYIKKGKLVMMGWGKIENILRELVIKENLTEQIYFIPPVSQEELLYWSSSADVGIIPYQFVGLNNYYSCPNKLFEYIAAGIAVAGSQFPEITRVIKEYQIGLTFDPENPQDIARAINEILEDKSFHIKMCRNTIKAREELNWGVESRKLLKIYNEYT